MADRVALITGGAGGIGSAAARRLAADFDTVVIADRDLAAAEAHASDMQAKQLSVEARRIDVTNADEFQMVARDVEERCGPIEFLFNNAGIDGPIAPLADYSPEEFYGVLAVNLFGVFHGLRAVLPLMMARGRGSIVNTASMAALLGPPSQSAYVASKAGVVGLTRVAAREGGPHGVRVNAICPAPIATPMMQNYLESTGDAAAALAQVRTRIPLGRPGEPTEVADVVAYLASEQASFITGVILPVDGGRSVV